MLAVATLLVRRIAGHDRRSESFRILSQIEVAGQIRTGR
jgi:hypothetical protein